MTTFANMATTPSSSHSDLYVTVQVWAGSKAFTVPVQTAYKAFRTERK
jgi:phosphatidylinositol 3-kinase